MLAPEENIGKIFTSLEKYFDTRAGEIRTKFRPVLIIGCEQNYSSPMNVDYELLPISKIENHEPDPIYDIKIDGILRERLGLKSDSYIRTNKISWNHAKHMRIERPVGDLKNVDLQLFLNILKLNEFWVQNRNKRFL